MKNTLTAIQIKKAGDGKLFDGGGLTLVKTGDAGKWVYRYSHLGRRREMGLGAWPAISLAEARSIRDRWASDLAAGRDPIEVRDAARAAEMADRDKTDPTFAEAAQTVFDSIKARLRADGTRGRWMSPMTLHVIPKIGRLRISEVRQHHIRDALSPIWKTKHPTAIKCIDRTRIVLREGRLMGYQCDPFYADAAQRMLGEVRYQATKIPSTPWQEIPALYARLPDTVSGNALRLLILTAVRMDGVRGISTSEIEGDIWTVPADRVKGTEATLPVLRRPQGVDHPVHPAAIRPAGTAAPMQARRGYPEGAPRPRRLNRRMEHTP